MERSKSAQRLESRYQGLASKLERTGLILQGTITERMITGDKDKKQKADVIYGPYYQWTFKREGKTVTVNLTSKQAKTYQKAIDNNRKLEETIKEMRILSEQILMTQTEGVKKRKPRK